MHNIKSWFFKKINYIHKTITKRLESNKNKRREGGKRKEWGGRERGKTGK